MYMQIFKPAELYSSEAACYITFTDRLCNCERNITY